ncbi:hypothetical protein FGO68_gene5790 [Halteria grandinella]|uniref:Uncharacterized protein n=1 Tax=Halteria grandinella TaxID=5974 RepID=A0A8J8NUH6_HALGN|nr:hypothetical protein FGO68_gene5790 [Halteria grandinella]
MGSFQALSDFVEKEFKKQEQLRCVAHPKYKAKLYSESEKCFYCYKCLAKEKLIVQNVMPINDMLRLLKREIINQTQEYSAKLDEVCQKYNERENLQIQLHLIERKQQAADKQSKLIELIIQSQENQCRALDEAAKKATQRFNSACKMHIQACRTQALDIKAAATGIPDDYENLVESHTQLVKKGKQIESMYQKVSAQIPDWKVIAPKTEDWKEEFKKYDKLNIDGTVFEQLAEIFKKL